MLLSLLLLSAVAAISFSLATIVFVEIRASSDVQRTEPTFYATQAVVEEATFAIKRTTGQTAFPTSFNCIGQTNTCISLVVPPPTRYRDVVITEKISPLSTTYTNTANKYYLVNPDDLYADTDGGGSPDGSYGKLQVTNIGDVPVRVALCPITVNDCVTPGTGLWEFSDIRLNPGSALGTGNQVLSPTTSYTLYILYDGAQGGSQNGYVRIATFSGDGVTARGIPYFGKKAVDITASYLGLTRKYRAVIPEQ